MRTFGPASRLFACYLLLSIPLGCSTNSAPIEASSTGDSEVQEAGGPDSPEHTADAGSGDAGLLDSSSAGCVPFVVDNGTASAPGDRHLCVDEPYPDAVLVQHGGRFINVTKPPAFQDGGAMRAAIGDGIHDDTGALQDAFDFLRNAQNDPVAAGGCGMQPLAGSNCNYWIYVPNGVYRVTETIIYTGPPLFALSEANGGWWGRDYDLVKIRIVGESRERTTIRLDDSLPAFGDAGAPKAVLSYQHPETPFENVPGENVLRNMTIDVGRNNPGAAGVMFQGANQSAMNNVLVRSGDGSGRYGIWFAVGSAQGYHHDLTVTGFDFGVFQEASIEGNTSLEYVTLSEQRLAAMQSTGNNFAARKVRADESTTGAAGLLLPALGGGVLKFASDGGVTTTSLDQGSTTVVLESDFIGSGDGGAAIASTVTDPNKGSPTGDPFDGGTALYLRSVNTTGYATTATVGALGEVVSGTVDEFVSGTATTLFPSTSPHSLALPVEDTPLAPWFDPSTQWANVEDFRSVCDAGGDDSCAVQAAMDSGKPVVYFPKATYHVPAPILVPASVVRIDGMFASLQGGDLNKSGFWVNAASTTPLIVRYFDDTGSGWVVHAKQYVRPIVLDLFGSSFDNQTGGQPLKLYAENVELGAGDTFTPAGQSTWARGINDERKPQVGPDGGSVFAPSINATGGSLWVFDFKTECESNSSFRATNGAQVEVLGGYVNVTNGCPADGGPLPYAPAIIENDNSDVSFVGQLMNRTECRGGPAILEQREAGVGSVQSDVFPRAIGSYASVHNRIVPLYVGRSAGK